jgi:hypothetical protein
MPQIVKVMLIFGALGLAIGLGIAAYMEFTPPHHLPSDQLFLAFVILCPPSLLSVAIIDAEPGTGAFYAVWLLISVINAFIYMGVIGVVGLLVFAAKPKDRSSN